MNHFDTKHYDAKFSKLYEFAIFVDFLKSILKNTLFSAVVCS